MALLGPFYALQQEVRLDILEARRKSLSCSVNGMAIFYTMMPLLDDLVPLWAEWCLVYQEGGNVLVGIWSLVNIGELDQALKKISPSAPTLGFLPELEMGLALLLLQLIAKNSTTYDAKDTPRINDLRNPGKPLETAKSTGLTSDTKKPQRWKRMGILNLNGILALSCIFSDRLLQQCVLLLEQATKEAATVATLKLYTRTEEEIEAKMLHQRVFILHTASGGCIDCGVWGIAEASESG
ncbi:hypothetical protein Tco_1458739 [Tanacetum coccineum]